MTEHEAAQLSSLLRAIALVCRDRDGSSSPALRAQRARLEQVCSEMEDLIFETVKTAVRVHLRGDNGQQDSVVRRAHRVLDSSVQAIRLLLLELGPTS